MVNIQTTIEDISTSKDKLDSNKRSEIHTAETDGKSIQSNSITEEIRTLPEKRNESQKPPTKSRKKVHSSNKTKVDPDDFCLNRKQQVDMLYPVMNENNILTTKRLTSSYKPTRILCCLQIVTI